MSAVVEAISDAVSDVFEAVGDVVEDVVEFVGEAVEKVGDVVQAVIDDPLPVLLSVAGSFVGIPPFVTMGAVTAARGGDLEDIALSMGTAYFAPQVGSALSSTVSSAFIDAGFNEAFTQVASDSISKGLVNGTIAEIKGGSFDDGFAGGFTGGLVQGGVGEVASYVKPDVVELALDSGFNLNEATSIFNAGVKAVSAGVTSEITGKGDFATSFTNSAIGSGVDAGTRSLNATIDTEFNTAATGWNNASDDGDEVDTTVVGGGIPNNLVGEVTVSSIGFDTTADDSLTTTGTTTGTTTSTVNNDSTIDTATVLNDSLTDDSSGETAVSDISVLPTTTAGSTTSDTTTLAQAPTAESTVDFEDLIDTSTTGSGDTVIASNTDLVELPDDVSDIAETLTTTAETPVTQGALTTVAEANQPVDVLDVVTPDATAVTGSTVTETPIAGNLLTEGLNTEQPIGGLNAVAKTADDKMATSLGLKPTDITKPVVATVGSLLKSALKQGTKPQARTVAKRPAGALQTMAKAPRPKGLPPARMDVSKLMPIQKATPVAPQKTLASTAKLSPVSNIAGLTSLVKKTG
jgi:hypothetical protein